MPPLAHLPSRNQYAPIYGKESIADESGGVKYCKVCG